MSISRTQPRHCRRCGQQKLSLVATFTNGIGWRDLCARCSDGDDAGPPRAYTGPNPLAPQVAL